MTESRPGRILHVQRLSTEDGPGIRTTVFLKGCPLACAWCHNPESISLHPQVQWLENRCIGCRTCLGVCPRDCLEVDAEGRMHIDRERCDGCGICADACPATAMERLGTTVTVEELVHEVCKDRAYYETSGGGVTVSGGEPLMQPDFVAAFLSRVRESGIATALDTCGLAARHSLEEVLPHVDLLLFDLKEIDTERHRAFTGQGNELILDTASFLREYIQGASGMRLWIRTPLIPGATATQENLAGLGAFIAHHLDGVVERWELCAFNNLCRDKYRRLDLEWPFAETPLLAAETVGELESWARESGVDPSIVIATGATRAEREGI
jgi:pyruvate formate lyase activating enzyme